MIMSENSGSDMNGARISPTKLFHVLQGWPPRGPNHFRWDGARLVYSSELKECSVVLTPGQWRNLWAVCDEVGLFSWPATVGDPHVRDGLLYQIEIEVGECSIRSAGQCVGSPPEFPKKLLRLHRALQSLVGWKSRFEQVRVSWFKRPNEIGIDWRID